ncbi:MAG: SPOR domain-containing protein [Rhodobacteraceae bacterium]|nr:SPOR domain-containing protein [Paracoccaceae bacterium]
MGIDWSSSGTRLTVRSGLFALLMAGVASCDEEGLQGLNFGKKNSSEETVESAPKGNSIKLVERDVEAPEAFEVNTKALWDGRPSLGGVWVAHPDSKQPERVIIRNETNGKFVIGALFRRERANPGPLLQLSSDAASALGVLAGTPTMLKVTALRRETVNVEEKKPTPEPETPETVATTEIEPVSTSELESSVIASVKKAEKQKKAAAAPAAPTPLKSKLKKPYVQIGFFSVESNASDNVAAMKKSGIPAKMVKSSSNGKPFWRVIAGPAGNSTEQKQLLAKVKAKGFTDAYFVSE